MNRDDHPELDPALADAVRRAYVRPVDEGTAQQHLSAIVAASTANAFAPIADRALRRRGWWTVVVVGATTLLAPVGLAVAGVSLPDAVEQPYRAVGIKLPHQAADKAPLQLIPAIAPITTSTTPATAASPLAADRQAPRPQTAQDHKRSIKPTGTPRKPSTKPGATTTPGHSAAKTKAPHGRPTTTPQRTPARPKSTPARTKPHVAFQPSTPAHRHGSQRKRAAALAATTTTTIPVTPGRAVGHNK